MECGYGVWISSVDFMIGTVRGTASRAPPTTQEQEHRPPQGKQAINTPLSTQPMESTIYHTVTAYTHVHVTLQGMSRYKACQMPLRPEQKPAAKVRFKSVDPVEALPVFQLTPLVLVCRSSVVSVAL